jgi:hypothetical protein
MSFLLPSAFWLTACAVPIVVFYILKVRLRRQPVSTNLFWRQIYEEKPPRSIWQYLRHLLSLLAQLALLALLVLAIADPYLPWELLQARRIVMVIDRSASMQADDIHLTRFAAAIDAAVTQVDGLRFRDELAIIAAGPEPEVVAGMNGHVPTLKRVLRGLTVSDGPTNLTAAIDLAKQLVGKHPHGQVLVFTDGCIDAPTEPKTVETAAADSNPLTDEPTICYLPFGTRASNVGITQLQVRRSLVDSLGYEALVSVFNASDREVQCRLELTLEDLPVDVLPLKLKPNEKWQRSLQKTSVEGGILTAKLTQITASESSSSTNGTETRQEAPNSPSPNVLTVDDTASAILAPREPQRVLLVTEGNLFMQKVFQANPLVKCEVVKEIPKEWPKDTIVVLHRQVPAELPPGNVIVVEPTAASNAWDLGDTIENPIVTQQQNDSPLMAHVRLDNVLMPAAKKLAFKSSPNVLVATVTGDPIYASIKRDGGKCLVLSVDLDRSDLTFRTAFPILMTNALNWFRGGTGELQSALPTGSIAGISADQFKSDVTGKLVLIAPDHHESEIARPKLPAPQTKPDAPITPAADSKTPSPAPSAPSVSVGPFNQCGVWTLVSRESPEHETAVARFVVNLANERETDLRPDDTLTTGTPTIALAAGWFARPLWYYLAAVACLLAVVEWLLHQRRVIT